MLKSVFRYAVGFLTVAPFIVATKLLTLVVGEDRAITTIGPVATILAKLSLKLSMPKIHAHEDFNVFSVKVKQTLHLWKPFFDVAITEDSGDILKLKVLNCPFCEVLAALGLSRLSPYVCQGDWAFAEENKNCWGFERDHQIGTGNRFCDHTYRRLKSSHN